MPTGFGSQMQFIASSQHPDEAKHLENVCFPIVTQSFLAVFHSHTVTFIAVASLLSGPWASILALVSSVSRCEISFARELVWKKNAINVFLDNPIVLCVEWLRKLITEPQVLSPWFSLIQFAILHKTVITRCSPCKCNIFSCNQ